MNTLDLTKLNDRDREIVERLQDWFPSPEAFYEAVRNDDDKLEDALHEYADGEVSIYTSDRYEWIGSHFSEIALYEEEAINNGAKSIADIAASCWYEDERDHARNATDRLKNILTA